MKKCTRCKEFKELSFFGRDSYRPGGIRSSCKTCSSSTAGQWNKLNKRRQKSSHLKHRYGISIDQYEALLKLQKNKCACCGDALIKPCIDHDHRIGHVRGILCNPCNVAEGLLKTLKRAQGLVEYMQKNALFYSEKVDS